MKKIIILGAGTYQTDLIKKAKEMGLFTVVFSPGNYPGMAYADKVVDVNIMDKEAVYLAAKKERPDGIISDQTDMAVEAIAYACEKLGLPGNNYDTVKYFIDKSLMRCKCEELGLPSIKSARVYKIAEAKEFIQKHGFPVIIKPLDSCGSKGVTKITSEDELEARYADTLSYSSDESIIIEQFIDGIEFEVDSIAVNGHVEPLMYADLNEFNIPNIFASMSRLYPSIADKGIIDKLLGYDKAILEGFGLKQGLTHSEHIMDKNTGEIYLIETAVRGGGTFISSHIAELQTGLNTAEFLIRMALGELDDIPQFEKERCHCGYVAFYLPAGKIISLDGMIKVINLPYVAKTTMENLKIGMITEKFTDKRNRHAVILSASNRDQLYERIAEIKNMLKILIDTGKGIEGPIWE